MATGGRSRRALSVVRPACPGCGVVLPPDAIDPPANRFACPACGRTGAAEHLLRPDLRPRRSLRPPKDSGIDAQFRKDGTGVLRSPIPKMGRSDALGVAGVLGAPLLVWLVVVWGIPGLVTPLLFTGWAAFLVWHGMIHWFAWTESRFDRDGVLVEWRLFRIRRSRRIAYGDIVEATAVPAGDVRVDNFDKLALPSLVLTPGAYLVLRGGERVRFGAAWEKRNAAWLAKFAEGVILHHQSRIAGNAANGGGA